MIKAQLKASPRSPRILTRMVNVLYEMALDYDTLLLSAHVRGKNTRTAKAYAQAVWQKFPHPCFQFDINLQHPEEAQWAKNHREWLYTDKEGHLVCPAEDMLTVACPKKTPLSACPTHIQKAFLGLGRLGAQYLQEHSPAYVNFYLVCTWREIQLQKESSHIEALLAGKSP